MSIGNIFGIGGTSVISRALGEGQQEYAKKVCSFCMWICIIVGVLMTFLFLIFKSNILEWIGASEYTWNFAQNYLTIVSCSGVFVLISSCFSNILRAEGQATKAMTGQIIGNLINIILDPIMILILDWNITGAAIATVIGNVLAAIYYIAYFLRGKSSLSIKIKHFTFNRKICSNVLTIGIPASLGSMLMSISQMIMNGMMSEYGDMALAGIGVAMKVTMITSMISMGIGQGVQPLLGYCVGAKQWQRYKKIMSFSLCFAFLVGVIMTLFCYIFSNQIISVFLTEQNAFDYAVHFAKILLTTSTLFGIFYVFINALQAMGAAVSSFIINISRQGIIYIPTLFVLKTSVGVTGLVWAQPVADVLSIVIALCLYSIAFQKMIKSTIKKVNFAS